MHWSDLPHARLETEIVQAINYRLPQEAHYDLQLRELKTRLPELDEEDHRKYARLVSAEMTRELRICRDTYRRFLADVNNKSRTAKWGVALDLAIAPMASKILRREIYAYFHDTKVEPWIVEVFLARNVKVVVPLSRMKVESQFSQERSLQEVIRSAVPDQTFQDLKRRFRKESFMVGGPFAKPHILFHAMSYRLPFEDISMLYDANEIWVSQAGCMWDNVLYEIVAQQFQIDWEERADAMVAVEGLSGFDCIAGPLYAEASERYTTIPDAVWAEIGTKIDLAGISLENTLEPEGKKVLRDLAQRQIFMTTWREALLSDSDFGILPTKTVVDGTVKYRGMLNRHAKRAIYRARDKYRKALEDVYERRIHL